MFFLLVERGTDMVTLILLLAYHLIMLHGPGGHEIDVNPHEVSSLRDPSVVYEGHFAKGTKLRSPPSKGERSLSCIRKQTTTVMAAR